MKTTPTSSNRSLWAALRDLFIRVPLPRPGRISGPLVQLVLPVRPKPMPRPRVARNGGVFYPADYKQFEKELDRLLNDGLAEWSGVDGVFAVLIESVVPALKTSSNPAPIGDVDNLAKPVMDRITRSGKLWADDRQVLTLSTFKRFAEADEDPHYQIIVFQL